MDVDGCDQCKQRAITAGRVNQRYVACQSTVRDDPAWYRRRGEPGRIVSRRCGYGDPNVPGSFQSANHLDTESTGRRRILTRRTMMHAPRHVVSRILVRLVAACVLPTAQSAFATLDTLITINTAPLIGHAAGPFSLDFELIDGSGTSDANNTVTLSF